MEIARRFPQNPLITPADIRPSMEGLEVTGVSNPGVVKLPDGEIMLLLRVAERQPEDAEMICALIADSTAPDGLRTIEFSRNDPLLRIDDPRMFHYDGNPYLTTISHLRRATSHDGVHFVVDETPFLVGNGSLEEFGIEDVRISEIGGQSVLAYTAVSRAGVAVGMRTTRNWRAFHSHGVVLPPHNKDCAVFEEKIGGRFAALHRPAGTDGWGHFIWYAESECLSRWGGHRCVARTRAGMWDEARVGAGAAPVRTPQGWLAIYHGANFNHRYCLGALLLDLSEPWKVLARSRAPLMEPSAPCEQEGFLGQVVFTNGQLRDGDELTIYYGAADSVVCGARFSISEILEHLH